MACACTCCCGACCQDNGTCTLEHASECPAGKFQGPGTTCSSTACAGACCVNGTCFPTNKAWCDSQGGIWLGFGTVCSTTTCHGRCCYQSGATRVCIRTSRTACTSTYSGTYHGDMTTCGNFNCNLGACCDYLGSCTLTTNTGCSGAFRGFGTTCVPGSCPAVCFPVTVYRTGGIPVPGNCIPVAVGTISSGSGSVTVTGGFHSTYSSVEAQAVDSCGKCVWSGNNIKTGGGTASLLIAGTMLAADYPFQNTCPGSPAPCWCNNPMCNPLP